MGRVVINREKALQKPQARPTQWYEDKSALHRVYQGLVAVTPNYELNTQAFYNEFLALCNRLLALQTEYKIKIKDSNNKEIDIKGVLDNFLRDIVVLTSGGNTAETKFANMNPRDVIWMKKQLEIIVEFIVKEKDIDKLERILNALTVCGGGISNELRTLADQCSRPNGLAESMVNASNTAIDLICVRHIRDRDSKVLPTYTMQNLSYRVTKSQQQSYEKHIPIVFRTIAGLHKIPTFVDLNEYDSHPTYILVNPTNNQLSFDWENRSNAAQNFQASVMNFQKYDLNKFPDVFYSTLGECVIDNLSNDLMNALTETYRGLVAAQAIVDKSENPVNTAIASLSAYKVDPKDSPETLFFDVIESEDASTRTVLKSEKELRYWFKVLAAVTLVKQGIVQPYSTTLLLTERANPSMQLKLHDAGGLKYFTYGNNVITPEDLVKIAIKSGNLKKVIQYAKEISPEFYLSVVVEVEEAKQASEQAKMNYSLVLQAYHQKLQMLDRQNPNRDKSQDENNKPKPPVQSNQSIDFLDENCLFDAIEMGNIKQFQRLLECEAVQELISKTNQKNETVFQIVLKNKNPAALLALLNVDIELSNEERRAVYAVAIQQGHPALILKLLELDPTLPLPKNILETFIKKASLGQVEALLAVAKPVVSEADFQTALDNKRYDLVNVWIERGLITGHQKFENNLLIHAAQAGKQEMIILLVHQDANVNQKIPPLNQLLIQLAIEKGWVKVVEACLEREDLDLRFKDSLGYTPLHRVILNEAFSRIPDKLLGKTQVDDIYALIRDVMRVKSPQKLDQLLGIYKSQFNPDKVFDEALRTQDYKVLAVILKHYPHKLTDPSLPDEILLSMLSAGEVQAVLDILKLEGIEKLTQCKLNDKTLFETAVFLKHPEVAHSLLERDPALQTQAHYEAIITLVIELGQTTLLETLLEQKEFSSALQKMDAGNRSPMPLALKTNQEDLVLLLLKQGLVIEPSMLTEGQSPLQWAIDHSWTRVIEYILNKEKADAEALKSALNQKQFKLAIDLIEKGASFLTEQIMVFAQHASYQELDRLLKINIVAKRLNNAPITPEAFDSSNIYAVIQLAEAGVSLFGQNTIKKLSQFILQVIEQDDEYMIRRLLSLKNIHLAYVNIKDSQHLIEYAINNHKHNSLKVLLEKNVRVDQGFTQKTLYEAVRQGDKDLVEVLVPHVVKEQNKGLHEIYKNKGDSLLALAFKNKSFELIPILIQYGVDITQVLKEPNWRILDLSIGNDWIEIFDACLDKIKNNPQTQKNLLAISNPLIQNAVNFKRPQMLRKLLEASVPIEFRCPSGKTALHYALGEPIDKKNAKTQLDIIEMLLSHPALSTIINIKDNYQRTALDFARQNLNFTAIRKLLEKGAQYDNKPPVNPYFKDPLMDIAIKNDQTDLILYLIDKFQFISTDQIQQLHEYAMDKNKPEICLALLEKGFYSSAHFSFKNDSLLGDVLEKGWDYVFQALIQKNGIDTITGPDHCALHLAAKHKRVDMMKLLLQQGANVNATDSAGNTPLHSAVANHQNVEDYSAIDILLSQPNINLNLANKLNQTPLDLAYATKNLYLVMKLVSKGADHMKSPQLDQLYSQYGFEQLCVNARIPNNGLDALKLYAQAELCRFRHKPEGQKSAYRLKIMGLERAIEKNDGDWIIAALKVHNESSLFSWFRESNSFTHLPESLKANLDPTTGTWVEPPNPWRPRRSSHRDNV